MSAPQKVLITPQVTGPIVAVHVVEGQKVKAGDPLFDIDPEPYEIALALAKGRLEAAKVEFANLRSSYREQCRTRSRWARTRSRSVSRTMTARTSSSTRGSGTGVDRDTSMAALIQAKQILEFVRNQQASTIVKLGGSLDASIDNFPEYMQAKAGCRGRRAQPAQHQGRRADRRRGDAGAQIELGRVAPAGQPVFAVVADTGLWVDANPKESDMTYVRAGQPATVTIDAFPDRVWNGTVCSIAPGHRRAIRDPAAAERERQLGQGRPARAAALLLRSERGHEQPARRHERLSLDRHRPRAHAWRRDVQTSPVGWGLGARIGVRSPRRQVADERRCGAEMNERRSTRPSRRQCGGC